MQIFKSFTPEVIELLKNGAVGVIPTDTLYGVVGLLLNEDTVNRMYKIKNRDLTKPVGTVIISNASQVKAIADPVAVLRAEQYWPGPTSVIIPVKDSLAYAHKGYKSLPFRIPKNQELRELIDQTGPLATSSANLSGQSPVVTVQNALDVFADSVDFYVDGGDLSNRQPSRIVRINNEGKTETIRGDIK